MGHVTLGPGLVQFDCLIRRGVSRVTHLTRMVRRDRLLDDTYLRLIQSTEISFTSIFLHDTTTFSNDVDIVNTGQLLFA